MRLSRLDAAFCYVASGQQNSFMTDRTSELGSNSTFDLLCRLQFITGHGRHLAH